VLSTHFRSLYNFRNFKQKLKIREQRMGRVQPMALACQSSLAGKASWPAHAHRRMTRCDHVVAAHYRCTVTWPVWFAGSLLDDEVDEESIAKLLASRRA
jgi:hypothetical protein